jgi:colicin import membrane protein
MKRFLAFLLSLAAAAHAQDEDPKVAAERARLAAARSHAEIQYKAEEKACYSKFAVNDCVAAAKVRRRQALEDVRRQEISINDAERKRKAAERLRAQQERDATQPQRQEAAQERAAQEPAREQRAGEKAGSRASQAASAPQKAAERQQELQRREEEKQAEKRRRDQEAAENLKERDKRLAEAQERKEKLQKRIAERKKPPASALATPP